MKAHVFGTEHQMKYRALRAKEGAMSATANRELQVITRAFKLGAEHEPPLVKRTPKFKITKEGNARKDFVTIQQLNAIKDEALKYGFEYRVIVEMAHVLGWHKGELVNL